MIVERQDIDALLISALYGELTPSQESELTAHLASHPADKLALEGLTATRDAVRSSRILAVQLEPPQSVSALLIQEAARRAPKSPAEGEGWFGRFVRTFVQHPAMAAAAMLVLIVGIAGVVGRNKGNQFANESSDQSLTSSAKSTAAPAAAPADRFEGGAAGSSAANQVAQTETMATAPAGTASGSGSALREGAADTGAVRDEVALNGTVDRGGDKMGMGVTLAEEKNQQGTRTATADGIVLDRRAAGPKDFASDGKKAVAKESPRNREEDQQKAKQSADKNADLDDGESFKGVVAPQDMTAAKAPGASGGAAAPPPPPPPPPVQPTQQYATPPMRSQSPTTPTTTASAPQTAPRVVAPVSPAPAATVKAEPKAEAEKNPAPAKTESKAFEQKPAEAPKPDVAKSDPTTDWAKAQHASLVAKARNNQCSSAAELAVTIENRAPSYYAQFIANDRDLKNCTSYITAAREKEAEKRASVERAKKAEPKAVKKADAPTPATSTDSK